MTAPGTRSGSDQLSADLASLRIDRTERPPRSSAWIVVLGLLAAAAVAGVLGYNRLSREIFKTDVSTTEVIVVSPAQASTELTGVGYMVAQRQSKVACQILSRIADMRVKEGDRVEKGQLLFSVEDAAQRANLSAARSRALAAKARVESVRAALTEIRQQLERETRLVERKIVNQAGVDDLRERARAQESLLGAAEQDAAAATEDVGVAQVQLDYTTVEAPFAGVVRAKPLDAGEMLGTFNEKPAVDLYDPSTLLAEIDVPEKRLAKIRPGGPAEVVLEAYPENRWRAVVEEVGSGVDRSKGTVVARLRLLERPERLIPDMRARASFLAEALDAEAVKAPPKTVVPRAAVAVRGGAKVVFRIEEGRARAVPVTLGPEFGGGFELVQGPPPGTVLIADPPETLLDGQPVKEKAR